MIAFVISLIVVGINLAIFDFTSFSTDEFESAAANSAIFMLGSIMAMIGFALIRLSVIKPVSKYYATELSPAMKITGQSIAEGVKESGIGSYNQKEIIKIKCSHCGYLETEDVDFCSKCGKKL
jgi:hypothetical protein